MALGTREVEPSYLRVSGDENPSFEEMKSSTCDQPNGTILSFHYATEIPAAKEVGIPARGIIKVQLEMCVESPALSRSFVIKGRTEDQRLRVEGTYFPREKVKYGKLVVRSDDKPKERKKSR